MRRGSVAILVFVTAIISLMYFFSDSIFRQRKSQATSIENMHSISSLIVNNLPNGEGKEGGSNSTTAVQSPSNSHQPSIEVDIKNGDLKQNHPKKGIYVYTRNCKQ